MALDCYSLVQNGKPWLRVVRTHCHWQFTRQTFPSMKLATNLRTNMEHLGEWTTAFDEAKVWAKGPKYVSRPSNLLKYQPL